MMSSIAYRPPPSFSLSTCSNGQIRVRYCSRRRVSWIDGGLNRSLWRNFISFSPIEARGKRNLAAQKGPSGMDEWRERAAGFSPRGMIGLGHKAIGNVIGLNAWSRGLIGIYIVALIMYRVRMFREWPRRGPGCARLGPVWHSCSLGRSSSSTGVWLINSLIAWNHLIVLVVFID